MDTNANMHNLVKITTDAKDCKFFKKIYSKQWKKHVHTYMRIYQDIVTLGLQLSIRLERSNREHLEIPFPSLFPFSSPPLLSSCEPSPLRFIEKEQSTCI